MSGLSRDAYVGLGSNLDSPVEQVARAFEELATLPKTRLLARSALYRSAPVGPVDQPDYINAVARLSTRLAAPELLHALQAIELSHGRVRAERWGPRTLDLDLLLYGTDVIDTPILRVPHPEMHRRAFVLVPLSELEPGLELPLLGRLDALLQTVDSGGLERITASHER